MVRIHIVHTSHTPSTRQPIQFYTSSCRPHFLHLVIHSHSLPYLVLHLHLHLSSTISHIPTTSLQHHQGMSLPPPPTPPPPPPPQPSSHVLYLHYPVLQPPKDVPHIVDDDPNLEHPINHIVIVVTPPHQMIHSSERYLVKHQRGNLMDGLLRKY